MGSLPDQACQLGLVGHHTAAVVAVEGSHHTPAGGLAVAAVHRYQLVVLGCMLHIHHNWMMEGTAAAAVGEHPAATAGLVVFQAAGNHRLVVLVDLHRKLLAVVRGQMEAKLMVVMMTPVIAAGKDPGVGGEGKHTGLVPSVGVLMIHG